MVLLGRMIGVVGFAFLVMIASQYWAHIDETPAEMLFGAIVVLVILALSFRSKVA